VTQILIFDTTFKACVLNADPESVRYLNFILIRIGSESKTKGGIMSYRMRWLPHITSNKNKLMHHYTLPFSPIAEDVFIFHNQIFTILQPKSNRFLYWWQCFASILQHAVQQNMLKIHFSLAEIYDKSVKNTEKFLQHNQPMNNSYGT
jgi:hypothetical protein